MYYIYEIIGVKVGCTQNMKRRQRQQAAKGKMILLESYSDIQTATRRERELQIEKNYRVDKDTYSHVVENMLPKALTVESQNKRVQNTDYKEVSKKRVKNTDWAKKVKNTNYKAKVFNTDYNAIVSKKNYKKIMSHRQRAIIAVDPDSNSVRYSGINEASRQLSSKTGLKFNAADICTVCNPEKIHHKSHHGYKFNYV